MKDGHSPNADQQAKLQSRAEVMQMIASLEERLL